MKKLDELLQAVEEAGRVVTSVRQVNNDLLSKAYAERLKGRQSVMFHTTTCKAASAIAAGGFDLSKGSRHGGAFGQGVNLGRTKEQALMYASDSRSSCTLVCLANVGRRHANRSVKVPGKTHTVPVHVAPLPGYDSMYGMGGDIVVVPDPRRVLPLYVVKHRPL
jgi:hypothetical protein